MLKRIICAVLLVFLGFGISANALAAERFKWITSTDEVTISYDIQTVRYNSNYGKTVDVWVRWQFTEDGAMKMVENQRKNGHWQNIKWNNFSHSIRHYLLNSNYQYDVYEVVYYDREGNLLESSTFKHEWSSVIPDSLGEEIYNNFAVFLKSR